jgi:hypothetical protein
MALCSGKRLKGTNIPDIEVTTIVISSGKRVIGMSDNFIRALICPGVM